MSSDLAPTPTRIARREYAFASDNTAGICPEAWAAMVEANAADPVPSYGDDAWTKRATDLFRQTFEVDCDVYFVFNGTAANSLALASLCQSYHSVICHEKAHVETDECGAPEFYSNGSKLLTLPGHHGKLQPADVDLLATKRTDIHFPRPRALSITQATELGTVYTPAEIAALSEVARRRQMRVHMDGSRFANAVASLGVTPADLSWKSDVDVLCVGGTKNGMAVGEAVVFFDRGLSEEFAYRCKQAGQLASKMRFMSTPWVGMLRNGAWTERAGHANRMAQQLGAALAAVPGVSLMMPVQANGVFAILPPHIADGLRERGWRFYTFIGAGGARFMCSWATEPRDIEQLAADANEIAATAAVGAV